MLKKILTIITLCTSIILNASTGATGEPIDVTSLYDIVYEYDKLNRVTKATYASGESIAYSYDAGGNLLGVVFDDPNEVEKPNLKHCKYDEGWSDYIMVNNYRPEDYSLYSHKDILYIEDNIYIVSASCNDSDMAIDLSGYRYYQGYLNDTESGYANGRDIEANAKSHGYLTALNIARTGKYVYKKILDPENALDESNEQDNRYEKTFYVMSRDGDSDNDGMKDVDEGIIDTDNDGIVNFLDTDSDDDGMSDKDEHIYGFDPLNNSDATEDADGDGISNIDEINAGTDPQDASSSTFSLAIVGTTKYFLEGTDVIGKRTYDEEGTYNGFITLTNSTVVSLVGTYDIVAKVLTLDRISPSSATITLTFLNEDAGVMHFSSSTDEGEASPTSFYDTEQERDDAVPVTSSGMNPAVILYLLN